MFLKEEVFKEDNFDHGIKNKKYYISFTLI